MTTFTANHRVGMQSRVIKIRIQARESRANSYYFLWILFWNLTAHTCCFGGMAFWKISLPLWSCLSKLIWSSKLPPVTCALPAGASLAKNQPLSPCTFLYLPSASQHASPGPILWTIGLQPFLTPKCNDMSIKRQCLGDMPSPSLLLPIKAVTLLSAICTFPVPQFSMIDRIKIIAVLYINNWRAQPLHASIQDGQLVFEGIGPRG